MFNTYICLECGAYELGPTWRLNYHDVAILDNSHDKWPVHCGKELKPINPNFWEDAIDEKRNV
jgi:hypothetical protein